MRDLRQTLLPPPKGHHPMWSILFIKEYSFGKREGEDHRKACSHTGATGSSGLICAACAGYEDTRGEEGSLSAPSAAQS